MAKADDKDFGIRTGKNHIQRIAILRLDCDHTYEDRQRVAEDGQLFEIVPDFDKKNTDEVKIYYQGDKNPPPESLTVIRKRDNVQEQIKGVWPGYGGKFKKYEFKGLYAKPDTLNPLKKEFWKNISEPEEYQVKGLPKDLKVCVYHPHKWKIEIKFPPMRGIKEGYKLEKNTSKTDNTEKSFLKAEKNRTDTRGILSTESSSSVTATPGGIGASYKEDTTVGKRVKAITLERDSVSVDIDVLKWIGAVIEIANKTYGIIKEIKDSVPKIGWYCDFDLQFMQGTIIFEWGWKEYKDHRAYYWISSTLNFEFISIRCELGAGVSGYSFKAQAYVFVSGAVSAAARFERISPDTDLQFSLPITGLIEGGFGARCEAGFSLIVLKGEAKTGFQIEAKLKINSEKGFSVDGTLEWTGAKLTLEGSVGIGSVNGTKKKEFTLLDKQTIGSFYWPEEKQYNPKTITDDRLKTILTDKLCEGLNVKVRLPSGSLFVPDIIHSTEQIADDLVRMIRIRKDIRKDEKSMEGLAHDIRASLNNLNVERFGRDYIHLDRFQFFLFEGELKRILDKYIDPCLEIQKRLS